MQGDLLDFYKGMDISFVPQYLDWGVRMSDMDGREMDPFAGLGRA